MGKLAHITIGIALGLLAGCGDGDADQPKASDSTPSVPVTAIPDADGIPVDPATATRGTRVGDLVVDTVVARQTPIDSSYVGFARFTGRLTLTGRTMRNPDADLGPVEVCMRADSASARLLPRWAGDQRVPWFCFENRDDATRALGGASDGVSVAVVIERFTIHRGMSDEVNSAMLVRGARFGDGAGAAGPGEAILARVAMDVTSFLAGDVPLKPALLADTVDLHVAPEGGGGHARVSRERLTDRGAWRAGTGRMSYAFAPQGARPNMSMFVGQHVNCQPAPLAAKFPQLASRPHIGVLLEPPNASSCLESWNLTLVFDTTAGAARVVAAAYDQWEW